MSVNNNIHSLELPSHFSKTAHDPEIALPQNGKSWQLNENSLSIGNQSTKTLKEYSFKHEILERNLNPAIDYFCMKTDSTIPSAREISQFDMEDFYDKKNLIELIRLMSIGDDKIGKALGYTQHGSGTYSIITSLNLWECSCDYSKRFASHGQQALRNKFETELLCKMERTFSNLKDQKLNLLFLGSGGCLSEWKIISQAILSGFKSLEIYLVDRDYAKKTIKEFPERVQKFFEKFPQVKINVHILPSLEDFAKENIACDVACALDFDADTAQDPSIELKLSDTGFTFVTRKTTLPNWKWNNTDKDRHIVSRTSIQ